MRGSFQYQRSQHESATFAMTAVDVAIPLSRIETQLTVRRGRPWSAIERAVLEGLARKSWSKYDIADGLSIPTTIVDACLTRLMRVDWISMVVGSDSVLFRATASGQRALLEEEMPFVGKVARRKVTLLYDRLVGHVFTMDQVAHMREDELCKRDSKTPLVSIPPALEDGMYRVDELVDVLRDDEQLLGAEAQTESSAQYWGLVRVLHGDVTGLQSRHDLSDLNMHVIDGLQRVNVARQNCSTHRPRNNRSNTPTVHPVHISDKDIIVGAVEQQEAIQRLIRAAKSRIIIHSTFIYESKFYALWPLLEDAIERNVVIDILWGQEPSDEAGNSLDVARRLNSDPLLEAHVKKLRIHEYSTGSHAKLVIADAYERSNYVVLLGSCNWLATGFVKIEASIYLQTPAIVCDVLRSVCRLVQSGSDNQDPLILFLMKAIRALKKRPPPSNANATASLVIGDDHGLSVLRARDEARKRIFVVSHKMSEKVIPAILVPFKKARARRPITITALYSATRRLSRRDVTRLERDAADRRINLKCVKVPALHAKVLAWDEDSVVISSQNWMSADTPHISLASEIGIAVKRRGLASVVVEKFRRKVYPQPRRGPGSDSLSGRIKVR